MMGCWKSLHYKWQTSILFAGFILLSAGFVFLLVSAGGQSHVWVWLGTTFAILGGVTSLAGVYACVWAVRRDKTRQIGGGSVIICHPRESEIQTLTSESF